MKKRHSLIILNLLIVLPSVRFFSKFVNIYAFIGYLILFNLFIFLWFDKKIFKKSFSYPIGFIILSMLFLCNYFIYPILDARKKNANNGSTGDDSIIIAANTLKSSGKLYDVFINSFTPISPGPAWVIFNSPFTLLHIYFLFSPVYLSICYLIIKKNYGNVISNFFLILMISSFAILELFFNGHDILPFSVGFLICTLIIFEKLKKESHLAIVISIGILLGIVATSRIIFFFVPFLFYLLLKENHKKNSIILLFTSSIVFWGFNIYFFYINENYQPLHLIYKAEKIIGLPFIIAGSLILIIVNYLIIHQLKKGKIENWLLIISLIFSIILIPLSLGDLIRQNFNFKLWEGANYFVPIIPFYILYFILKNYKTKSIK